MGKWVGNIGGYWVYEQMSWVYLNYLEQPKLLTFWTKLLRYIFHQKTTYTFFFSWCDSLTMYHRFCSCRWTYIFRGAWYYFLMTCQPHSRHHQSADVGQKLPQACTHQPYEERPTLICIFGRYRLNTVQSIVFFSLVNHRTRPCSAPTVLWLVCGLLDGNGNGVPDTVMWPNAYSCIPLRYGAHPYCGAIWSTSS